MLFYQFRVSLKLTTLIKCEGLEEIKEYENYRTLFIMKGIIIAIWYKTNPASKLLITFF